MRKPVILASLTFTSKNSAREFFRNIRDRYQDGQIINDEDRDYLLDLVAIHSEADAKIGCGISHFTVDTNTEFGTRHFVIHRTNGTNTDVSFPSAIDGPNSRRDRFEALRRAVEDQILDFRSEAFRSSSIQTCPLRGISISAKSSHIDHIWPNTFLKLVGNWLNTQNIKLENIHITLPADNQTVTRMTDDAQLSSWQAFHAEHSELRAVSQIGNLSDAKRIKS